MNKLKLPFLEDEENNEMSPLAQEVLRQKEATTSIPDYAEQMNQVDSEVSAANEIANESQDLARSVSGDVGNLTKADTEQFDKMSMYKDMLSKIQKPQQDQSDLQKLQQDSLDRQKQLNWFRIGDKLAKAYGERYGGKVEGMQDFYNQLEKQAAQPIEDYGVRQKDEATQMTLQNEREMNDANSDISKFTQARAIAAGSKMGMNPEEIEKLKGMTAKQLEKLGFSSASSLIKPRVFDKNIVNPVTKKIESVLVDEQGNVIKNLGEAGYSYSSGIDPVTGLRQVISKSDPTAAPITQGAQPDKKDLKPEEITRAKLNPKEKDLLDKTRDELSKNKQYTASQEAVDGADNALALLKSGKDSGQDLVRAIQTMLAKSSGQVGVLTEQDVVGFNGRADALSRLERAVTTAAKGKLPEEDRKFLMAYANAMQGAAKRNIDQVSYIYTKQLSDDMGLDLKQAANLLTTKERLNPKQLSKENQDMIKVISPEGKIGNIPKENLEKALKKGFKKAE